MGEVGQRLVRRADRSWGRRCGSTVVRGLLCIFFSELKKMGRIILSLIRFSLRTAERVQTRTHQIGRAHV